MAGPTKKRSRVLRLWPVAAALTGLLWAGNFTVGLTELEVTGRDLPSAFDGFRIANRPEIPVVILKRG